MLKSKSEDSIKKYNLVSSENIRLRQDVNDLSRQVTTLLHEVEKLRTKLINISKINGVKLLDESMNSSKQNLNNSQLNESNAAEVSSSSEIISKDLLLFRYLFT